MLKILIIDDDEIVLLLQRKLLQRCGINYEMHTFKNGKIALKYLEERPYDEPVLILLDVHMPQMNGWEFLANLKEIEGGAKLYVIMVTSSIDISIKEAAAKYSKVIGFIEKPISIENCEKIKSMPQIKEYF